ncbi:(S)-acetoin forming diacetyl reductase [Leuconostoc fallax]|uniref:diacetyl reductase [(S)-acetoin forming] n=1 Tax=Leuconostoc fallax TaxID=1251 RepID=A0A4V3A2I8_9LACO|nr:(S)-acetoin forming diacetyl reductase [Leuconostoc fallax]MBU7455981.1 (S)-acetoin forming diacetyl reductase [Leuconostoc fallax]MCO6184339.1 (S)-acetoin forming diacetyl reductase [Leuconostoc fallax]TDG68825.1 hypothetical protein C5L23_000744 [Leuconostoc fallax]
MSKVALVTGAGQGIGASIAMRLANDGFAVALVGRTLSKVQDVADKITSNGQKAVAIAADVQNRDDMFRAVNEATEQLGDFNVIVNNAGVAPTTPIMEVNQDTLDSTWKINVGGTIWGTQAAVEKMRALGHGGKIINATSQAGVLGNPNLTVYGSTKFAIRGITQTTARELAADNITVNAFAPGIVKTPMMNDIAQKVADNAGKDFDWGMQQFAQDISLKRLAEPEDIANAVAFLASKDSDYVTGQTLIVDGGMVFQ